MSALLGWVGGGGERVPEGAGERAALARTLAHLALVVVLGLLAYSNTFDVPFQFDDRQNLDDPLLRDVSSFLALAGHPGRSFGYFTLAVNASLGGRSVAGFHVVNLAVHLATAVCVYFLVAFVFRTARPRQAQVRAQAPLAALVAAVFFVVHPVQTMAVTYIVQRLASLAALLYLAAVLAYGQAAEARTRLTKAARYAGALLLATLAMMTKEHAVTLVGALVLLELCCLEGPFRRRLLRLAPFAAHGVAMVVWLAPAPTVARTTHDFPVEALSADVPAWATYLFSQPPVLVRYLRLLVLPTGQNIDYDLPAYSTPLAPPVLLALGILAAVLAVPAALAWTARDRSPRARILLLAIGWFLVTISVESSVIPLRDLIFEHRVYLPSVGVFLALGLGVTWVLERARPGHRRLALAGIMAWAIALGVATHARNELWRDPLALWGDTLAKSPGKARPYNFVATELMEHQEYDRAIPLLERAVTIRPIYAHVFLNLGIAYQQVGRLADAERVLREGVARAENTLRGAHQLLGNVLLDLGRVTEACDEFEAEAGVDPGNRETRMNLVACRLSTGDAARAVAAAEKLATEDPGDALVQYNLAVGYSALGGADRAAGAYRRFLAGAGAGFAAQQEAARRWLAAHGETP